MRVRIETRDAARSCSESSRSERIRRERNASFAAIAERVARLNTHGQETLELIQAGVINRVITFANLPLIGLPTRIAAFAAKLLWELSTSSTLFVNNTAAHFTPLPLVHAVGGATGILTWLGFVQAECGSRRMASKTAS